jgi:hypothetical protein
MTTNILPMDVITFIFCILKQHIIIEHMDASTSDCSLNTSDYKIDGMPWPHSTFHCSIRCTIIFSDRDHISDIFMMCVRKLVEQTMEAVSFLGYESKLCFVLDNEIGTGWDNQIYLQKLCIHFNEYLGEYRDGAGRDNCVGMNDRKYLLEKIGIPRGSLIRMSSFYM